MKKTIIFGMFLTASLFIFNSCGGDLQKNIVGKWTADLFTQEEKIDCSFYITIESVVSPGVYNAKLSIVVNRPVFRANYTTSLLNMQDANFTFKYQLGQPIEFNENKFL